MHKLVEKFQPEVVVVDPIGSLAEAGNRRDASMMLIRLIDFLKLRGVTAFFTNLTAGGEAIEKTDVQVSSLVDTWLMVKDVESNGTRNRAMYVLKSRGMAHSNQLRPFLITDKGFDLIESNGGAEVHAKKSGVSRPRETRGGKRRTRGHASFSSTDPVLKRSRSQNEKNGKSR